MTDLEASAATPPQPGGRLAQRDIVVVGASAGGVEALVTFIGGLPAEFPAAVFVCSTCRPAAPASSRTSSAAGPRCRSQPR